MGKLFSKRKRPKQERNRRQVCEAEVAEEERAVMPATPTHTDAVVSLAAIQPGLCLSGSKDKTVVLYDYQNKRLEDKWTGHEREITKVCYGAGCQGIFSASRDKTVKMWQRGNSHALREFVGHELVVTTVHINSDNTHLVTGSRDNSVRLWDVESASCLLSHSIPQNLVTDVKFVPNSHLLVQTGEDKEVRLYDTRTMGVAHSFTKKQYIQMSCDVSADGVYCVTCSNGFGGNGCEATLWDLRGRRLLQEYRGHREAVEACIFVTMQGRHLVATASRDCSVKVWDRDSRSEVAEAQLDGSGPLTSLIAYEDESILVGSFNIGVQQLVLERDQLLPKSHF